MDNLINNCADAQLRKKTRYIMANGTQKQKLSIINQLYKKSFVSAKDSKINEVKKSVNNWCRYFEEKQLYN